MILTRGRCSQLQGALNSREREIGSLRRQLDGGQDDLATLRRDKDVTLKENRRLQDDLATMTRENQVRMRPDLPDQSSSDHQSDNVSLCPRRPCTWRWRRLCMRRTS